VFSLLRPSSAMQQGRRCSLAEIDDKLAAIQAERQAALCGAGNHPGDEGWCARVRRQNLQEALVCTACCCFSRQANPVAVVCWRAPGSEE
jgi:hypothetical protein